MGGVGKAIGGFLGFGGSSSETIESGPIAPALHPPPPPPPPPVVEAPKKKKTSTADFAQKQRDIANRSTTRVTEGFGLSSTGASTGKITLG